MLKRDDYLRWLEAAKIYYWGFGEDSGMSDLDWDAMSRKFFAERDKYPTDEYPVLHHLDFTGGSLFWLPLSEYPKEIKCLEK